MGQRSLWFDEADTALESINVTNFLNVMFKLYNPMVFYKIFIFYWRHVSAYINEWLLRLPSVIFAIAAILLMYKLAVLFFNDKRIGLISTFLLSVSPLHIYYSQEVVSYSFLVFIGIATVYCFVRSFNSNNIIYFSFFVALNIIGIYTHPVMWIAFFIENIVAIIKAKKSRPVLKKLILSNVIILLFCIPWLYSVFSGIDLLFKKGNFCFERTLGWRPIPTWKSIFFTVNNFALGYNAPRFLYPVSVALFLILFVRGITRAIKKENGLAILLFAVLPIFTIFTISKLTGYSYYIDRYFLPFFPFFCISVAYGIYSFNKKKTQIMILMIIIIMSAFSLNNYYRDILPCVPETECVGIVPKADIRAAAEYINASLRQEDTIYHTRRNTALPFEYYFDFYFKKLDDVFKDYPERLDNKQNILFYSSSDENTKQFLIREGVDAEGCDNTVKPYKYVSRSKELESEHIELKSDVLNNDRIWLVYSSWNFTGLNEPERYVVEWMDRNYVRESERKFKGLVVYLYRKKA